MSSESTPRAPRTRTYTIVEDGQPRTAKVLVDHRGRVDITEELLDDLLIRAGFTETTDAGGSDAEKLDAIGRALLEARRRAPHSFAYLAGEVQAILDGTVNGQASG